MNFSEIVNQIKKKKSYLCIGLDTDIKKIRIRDTIEQILENEKKCLV